MPQKGGSWVPWVTQAQSYVRILDFISSANGDIFGAVSKPATMLMSQSESGAQGACGGPSGKGKAQRVSNTRLRLDFFLVWITGLWEGSALLIYLFI